MPSSQNLDCPHFSAIVSQLQTHPSLLCFRILSIKICKLYSSLASSSLTGSTNTGRQKGTGRIQEGERTYFLCLACCSCLFALTTGSAAVIFWSCQDQLHYVPSNIPASGRECHLLQARILNPRALISQILIIQNSPLYPFSTRVVTVPTIIPCLNAVFSFLRSDSLTTVQLRSQMKFPQKKKMTCMSFFS